MILDTSAILAIFFREPERDDFLSRIGAAQAVGVGAPTLAETAIVLGARLGADAPQLLARIVERASLVVVSFDSVHWQTAGEAWLRFGKGRHPAALNFGDCLAYATAKVADEPLLCKGDDFAATDLVLA